MEKFQPEMPGCLRHDKTKPHVSLAAFLGECFNVGEILQTATGGFILEQTGQINESDSHSIDRLFDALFISLGKRYARYAGQYLYAQRRQPDPHDFTLFEKNFFLQFGGVETKFLKNRNETFRV